LAELGLTLPPRALFPPPPIIAITICPGPRTGAIVVAPVLIALLIGALLFIAATLVFQASLFAILPSSSARVRSTP
jgi:hypothetical protein